MELLQLRYFYDSAKCGSFAKTAEKYMVPASSISATIKRLEEELGCKLFDRTSNRVSLNDKGKRLKSALDVVFEELEQAVDSICDTADDHREIKLLVKAIRSIVTEYMIEYREKHVNTRFHVIYDFEATNFEDYDIIIDADTNCHSGYESFVLHKQHLRIGASKDNPLCGRKLTLNQLADEPFVTMSRQGNHHKLLLDACHNAGFKPNFVAQANDSTCFRKILESGIAIGVVSEYAGSGTYRANVTILNVTDFHAQQTCCVYYKQEAAYGNVKRFIEFLRGKAIV